MLMDMKDLPVVVQKNRFAVPAFNVRSDQLSEIVMKKVKELNSPVILEMSPDEFNFVGDAQIQAMTYEAAQTGVPVRIHLDHGDPYETATHAIRADMASAMIDASTLPYEESVAVTKKVVETAHIVDVSVESELRTIGTAGNLIEGGTQDVIYAVPEEAKQFVEDTGIDTFVAAIGAAHGIYSKDMRPELRVDILKDITSKVDVPLVLHDGSSNGDEEITAAVDSGICKINIFNDIKVTFCTQCRRTLNEDPGYREPPEIYPETMGICGKVVGGKIRLFRSNSKVRYYY